MLHRDFDLRRQIVDDGQRLACYGGGMTQDEVKALSQLRECVRRRRLFNRIFTPELLAEMTAFFGLDKRVFAFRVGLDGKYDPLDAMRTDTVRGVIESLRWEADEQQLKDALKLLEETEKAAKDDSVMEEVEHA